MIRTKTFRAILAGGACALLLAGAAAAQSRDFNVPAGDLKAALDSYAKQAGVALIYRADEVRGVRSGGVQGSLNSEAALQRVLSGTGFAIERGPTGAIAIVRGNGGQAQGDISDVDEATAVEEIIVTAQKREERLVETPQAVSVVSARDLERLGATQLRDFATLVPGLSFTSAGAGLTQVTLRGVTVGFDAGATTAVYVDEAPIGSATAFARGNTITVDSALFDVDRIEVLKGPQGTLYGAISLGGLVKYVTPRPSLDRFGGQVVLGISATNEGGLNHRAGLAVNMPIVTDKVALRASLFETYDAGYVDNTTLGTDNVNRSRNHGGRLDLLVQPSEALSLRLSGFAQDLRQNGYPFADYTLAGIPVTGDLKLQRRFEEPYEQRFRLLTGTIDYDLGWADLTSISNYQKITVPKYVTDISALFAPTFAALGLPYTGVAVSNRVLTEKFTQEVRLASPAEQRLAWVLGGFYTRERSYQTQVTLPLDATGQVAPNTLLDSRINSLFEEKALFGDLTWNATDRLDITVGARLTQDELTYSSINSGTFLGPSSPPRSSTHDTTTWLANARWRFAEDVVGYVRYASGYRPGGPNYRNINPTTGQPLGAITYEPDELQSWEVGLKAESEDRRFLIDVAAYHQQWDNIIIAYTEGGFSVRGNAPGGARIDGAELSVTTRPSDGVRLSGNVAYQKAQILETSARLGSTDGERLPNVPSLTAALIADYVLPVDGRPSIGATWRYVGDRTSGFRNGAIPYYTAPAYATLDLRGEMTVASVNVQLFVHNMFDERGQIISPLANLSPRLGPIPMSIIQPRTVGITLSRKF